LNQLFSDLSLKPFHCVRDARGIIDIQKHELFSAANQQTREVSDRQSHCLFGAAQELPVLQKPHSRLENHVCKRPA
jgi:hypothetical protein